MSIEFNNQDEERVSKVLASLPHVKPPGDFDVRVRSRIAAGKPADPRSWFWPVLAGATPLVLLVIVGVYFMTRTELAVQPTVASAPVVEQPNASSLSNNVASSNVANNSAAMPSSGDAVARTPSTGDRTNVPTTPVRGPNEGGSIDQAVTERRSIDPRGIGNNPRLMPKPRDFDNAISIPIKDVLTQIGVDSQGTTTGIKVVSVTTDGAANRLGLRANDIIESIDDKPVNEKTSYKGKFAGKKMRLMRDGKPVEIDLSKP